MPTCVDVPQTPFTHVAAWQELGAGQSAGALHDETQAPLPSHTRPPSSPHANPAGAGAVSQHPAAHAATRHGVEEGVQSLAWLHGLAQLPPSGPPGAPPVPTCPPVPAPVVVEEEPPVPVVEEPPVEELTVEEPPVEEPPVEDVPPTLPLFEPSMTTPLHDTAAIVSSSATKGNLERGRSGTFRLWFMPLCGRSGCNPSPP